MDSRFVLKRKRRLNSNSGAVAESIIPGVTMTYDNCSTPSCPPTLAHLNKRLIYGVGTNDHPTPINVNGKNRKPYIVWYGMLARCYSRSKQLLHPSYVGCTVAEDWHLLSNFVSWYDEHYKAGYQMDKDLLVQGNRVYSKDTCVFVSPQTNTLLLTGSKAVTSLPLGVTSRPPKFQAYIKKQGRRFCLGTFDTPLLAHQAWQRAKADHIESFPTTDPRIRTALDLRVAQLRDDLANNRITLSL